MANTSNKQFQTASARRKGMPPLTFNIEHVITPERPDGFVGVWEPEQQVIAHDLMVDPMVDVVRVGAAFGGFGVLLQSFGQASDLDTEEKMRRLDVELPRAREQLRNLLVPSDRGKWDQVKEGVDVSTLGEIVRWITTELSGLDPTRPRSSSTGSSTTTDGSTAGAVPAV